jgi:nucleotide-binding universal stress UspA family protein
MIKVLVPVVFSDYSLNGLTFGIGLSEKIPVDIIILHCFACVETTGDLNLPVEQGLTGRVDPMAELERQERETRQRLGDLAAQKMAGLTDVQKKNVTIHIRFDYGYPEDQIPKVARELNCDVVIMGSKTKDEIIKELLGSITSDVINRVSVPVLVVPAHSTIDLTRIGKVVFLTRFNKQEFTAMHRLINLMGPFNTEIHAIHFCRKQEREADLKRLLQFKEYCESTYRNHKILFHNFTGKEFIATLEKYVTEHGIDILAITHKKRNVLQRFFRAEVAHRLLYHTNIPLLVFHA